LRENALREEGSDPTERGNVGACSQKF